MSKVASVSAVGRDLVEEFGRTATLRRITSTENPAGSHKPRIDTESFYETTAFFRRVSVREVVGDVMSSDEVAYMHPDVEDAPKRGDMVAVGLHGLFNDDVRWKRVVIEPEEIHDGHAIVVWKLILRG